MNGILYSSAIVNFLFRKYTLFLWYISVNHYDSLNSIPPPPNSLNLHYVLGAKIEDTPLNALLKNSIAL